MGSKASSDGLHIAVVDEQSNLILENYVQFLIAATANKLLRSAAKIFPREFGATMSEWRILGMLAIEPDTTATRVCEVIGFDKAAASRCIKDLIDKGHVTARGVKTHNRTRLLSLTPSGRALHDAILKVGVQREAALLTGLSKGAHQQLLQSLRLLHANAGRMLEEVEPVPGPDSA